MGYDEFDELVAELSARQEPGDTLFVLPQTDSTPQLHPRTGMPPPGTWIKGWRWYFRPDFVLPALLDEWESAPPTWMVVFPSFITPGESGIDALLDFTRERYELRFTVRRHLRSWRGAGLSSVGGRRRMIQLSRRGAALYQMLSLVVALLLLYAVGFLPVCAA